MKIVVGKYNLKVGGLNLFFVIKKKEKNFFCWIMVGGFVLFNLKFMVIGFIVYIWLDDVLEII